jgi:hypothetical protein
MWQRYLEAFFLLIGVQLSATELQPWHGQKYEIKFLGKTTLQQFEWIDTKCGKVKRPECDGFYNASLFAVLDENITVEGELAALDSRHRLFGVQALRFTGRYWRSCFSSNRSDSLTNFPCCKTQHRDLRSWRHSL